MRELKFRAWCEGKHENMTFTKTFMDYDVIIVDGKYASVEAGWDIHGTYPTVPLMQYTGLKDKNGVDIYDGDILSFPKEEQIISIRWNETHACWRFDEHRGFDDGVGRGDWDFTIGIANSCEVIGNIYENPELL